MSTQQHESDTQSWDPGLWIEGQPIVRKPRAGAGKELGSEEICPLCEISVKEYWVLYEIAKTALEKQTGKSPKWRIVADEAKTNGLENMKRIAETKDLSPRARNWIRIPWFWDHFLHRSWKEHRRKYLASQSASQSSGVEEEDAPAALHSSSSTDTHTEANKWSSSDWFKTVM